MSKVMQRVIIHWTAGAGRASDVDKKHYHLLIEVDGTVVRGKEDIEDNIVTSDGDYAAHTLMLNTRSIGISMCGMTGAKEAPFSAGQWPLNEVQFMVLAKEVAKLCAEYAIPVTGKTVLTHAEVEPTLGVKQRGKWDITRIVFRPDIRGAIPCGDYIRSLVRKELGESDPSRAYPTVRKGDKGSMVRILQENLIYAGYSVGSVDGVFGPATTAAVLALQSDVGLITDGIVGPATWSKVNNATGKRRRDVTERHLRDSGSRTIANADEGTKLATRAGGGTAVIGAFDMVGEFAGKLQEFDKVLPALQTTLIDNWLILLVIAVGLFVMYRGPSIMRRIIDARTDDAQSGRNMGR